MNGDPSDIVNLSEKMDSVDDRLKYITSILEKKPTPTGQEAVELAEQYANEQKQTRTKFNRLTQKQKVYQAIPITLDSVSIDGKKDLQKSLKDIFTMPTETKDAIIKKKTNLFETLALISALLFTAYIFLKNKLNEVLDGIRDWLLGLNLPLKLGELISKLFEGIPKLSELLKLKVLEGLSKLFEGLFKLFDFSKLSGLLKVTPELQSLFKRLGAIPEEFLKMNVAELEKIIKEYQAQIKFMESYLGKSSQGFNLFVKDLEQLQKLKQAGMSADEIAKAAERFNKTQEAIAKLMDIIKGPVELLRVSIVKTAEGLGKFIEGIGKTIEGLIKFLPFGTRLLNLGRTFLNNLGPIAVLIDSFETAIHMFDKAKTGKLGAQEITTALTTLVLRAIGWLGGAIFFPLAFLRRETIETNIKGIFEEQDIMRKIIRMLLTPIDIIVKAVGETINFGAEIALIGGKIVRKVTEFFTGEKQEKGMFEYFLESFTQGFKKDLENLNMATIVMNTGTMIGEFVYDLVASTLNWFKEKGQALASAKDFVLSKIGLKSAQTVPAVEPQKANDFISRPGQRPIVFNPNDTIYGIKDPNSVSKVFVDVVKKIDDSRKEDRKVLLSLSDAIKKMSDTQANNVNMVNNSKNLTNITISPVTSKSYRESRFVV